MGKISKILLRGFLGVAPFAITLFLVIWLGEQCESLFRTPLVALFGEEYYFPGLGVLIAIVLIFCVGLIINTWLIQWIRDRTERWMTKIPLVKTIYSSVCDLMNFFQQGGQKQTGSVVIVEMMGVKLCGLVTRDTFDDLPTGIGSDGDVAVFLPFSYQLGGMTIFVPKSQVQYIDMSVERALRFTVTAASPSAQSPKTPPKC